MKTLMVEYHSDAGRVTCNGFDYYLPRCNVPCISLDNGAVLILEGWKWRFVAGEDTVRKDICHRAGSIKLTGDFGGYAVGSMMEVKDV